MCYKVLYIFLFLFKGGLSFQGKIYKDETLQKNWSGAQEEAMSAYLPMIHCLPLKYTMC